MKVLVVGGGGREHALVWRLAQDPAVTSLLAAPGNPGIAELAECHPTAIDDVAQMVSLVDHLRPDLVVVGPELPLVGGLADALHARGVVVFGPTAAAARLEGSKAFAKDLLQRSGIPTARSGSFDDVEKASAFVDELGGRAVVKADGLAAGKGVVVAPDRDDAIAAIRSCLVERSFGAAGAVVVVEELLEGPEVSAFALSDGERTVPLSLSRDHKRVGDGDTGPNTGGMGAYAPVPSVDAATEAAIWPMLDRTIAAMAADGTPYRGVLFAGFMLTDDGPKVLEFNCRFGDPEAQVVLPRLASDPAELFRACATGLLEDRRVRWRDEPAVSVVVASGGYPGPVRGRAPDRGAGRGRGDGGRHGLPRRHRVRRRRPGRHGRRARARRHGDRGRRCARLGTGPTARPPRSGSRARATEATSPRTRRRRKGHERREPAGRGAGGIARRAADPATGRIDPREVRRARTRCGSCRRRGTPTWSMSTRARPSTAGVKVVICSTGLSGHLAAAVAARTVLPVIGVPIATAPQMVGNEALAITAQMPTGVPIATVGVDAAVNAAILACEILGVADEEIQARLWKFKDDLAEGLKL